MAVLTVGSFGIDFDLLDLASLRLGQVLEPSESQFVLQATDQSTRVLGAGFAYDLSGSPTSGTISGLTTSFEGSPIYSLSGMNLRTSTLFSWIDVGANETAKIIVLSGADSFIGSEVADRMRGYAGADTINGNGGDDFVEGGSGDDRVYGDAGNDTVVDTSGSNYLRGGAGDDSIVGGVDFDDAHGNIGNDTVAGGGGDDWVVGGQGNDVLYGDAGGDLVYGQLGDDIVSGGDGSDAVVGGQGNDSLFGGAGNDLLSGDRGDDTLAGGAGADRFHISSASGVDRIVDFNASEGDRIQLDPGLTYTMSQSGSDTTLSVTGGAQVILVGVPLSAITPDIFS